MHASDSEGLALLGRIHDECLDAPPRFFGLALSQVQAAYNGPGPDWEPDLVAKAAAVILWIWLGGVAIHDCEYAYFNDGTRESWHEANKRFRENGLKSIRYHLSWWRIFERRAHYKFNDFLFATVESDAGWKAWRDAYEKYNPPEPGPEVMAS